MWGQLWESPKVTGRVQWACLGSVSFFRLYRNFLDNVEHLRDGWIFCNRVWVVLHLFVYRRWIRCVQCVQCSHFVYNIYYVNIVLGGASQQRTFRILTKSILLLSFYWYWTWHYFHYCLLWQMMMHVGHPIILSWTYAPWAVTWAFGILSPKRLR